MQMSSSVLRLTGIAIAVGAVWGGSSMGLARAQSDSASNLEAIRLRAAKVATDMVQIRRDLHAHPDLAGAETRTAGLIADRLKAAGLEGKTGVGGTGVIGVLRGRAARPVDRLSPNRLVC